MTFYRIAPRPGPHLALAPEGTGPAFCHRLEIVLAAVTVPVAAIVLVEEIVPAVVIDPPSCHCPVAVTVPVAEIDLVVETDQEAVIDPVEATDHPSCRYQVIDQVAATGPAMVTVQTGPAMVTAPIDLVMVTVQTVPVMAIAPIGRNVHRERGLRSTCLSTHRSIDHRGHVPRDGDHQGRVHQDGVHQATDHLCTYRCMAADSGIAIHGAGAGTVIP